MNYFILHMFLLNLRNTYHIKNTHFCCHFRIINITKNYNVSLTYMVKFFNSVENV